MATCFAPLSISGGSHLKTREAGSLGSLSCGKVPTPARVARKSHRVATSRNLSVCAGYRDSVRGGGGDFVAGFLLGGAIFGTLAYVFAPQIRRSILNEDEYGFRRAKRPIYYDGGLEKTKQTLNEKIGQLNNAIDNISSRLRGGSNNTPAGPLETDPEVEAAL